MSKKTDTLKKLREYFLNEGSTHPEDVAEFLGVKEDLIEGLVEDLKAAYPKDFGGAAEEEEEYQFFLKTDAGILEELEQIKEKNGKIIFIKKEPKDLVDIVLKGEKVTVDLFQLRKPGAAAVNGVQASVVVQIAELAKG